MLNNFWKIKLNTYVNIYNNITFRYKRKLKKNKKFKFSKYFGKNIIFRQQNFLKYLNNKTKKSIKIKYIMRPGTHRYLRNFKIVVPLRQKVDILLNKLKKNYWIMNNYPKYVFVNYVLLMGCVIKEPELFEIFYPFRLKVFKEKKRMKDISEILYRYKKLIKTKTKNKNKNILDLSTFASMKNLYIKRSFLKCKKILKNKKILIKKIKINKKILKNYIKRKNGFILNSNFNKSYKYKYMYNYLKNKLVKKLVKREKVFSGAGYFNRYF